MNPAIYKLGLITQLAKEEQTATSKYERLKYDLFNFVDKKELQKAKDILLKLESIADELAQISEQIKELKGQE